MIKIELHVKIVNEKIIDEGVMAIVHYPSKKFFFVCMERRGQADNR